jgi:glyoxylase-like metal-dependent hydrolase (beta-lactamase superfamily II)
MAEVKILVPGYFEWLSENKLKASSTVTLIKDSGKNIIFDTGSSVVSTKIVDALKNEGLTTDDIDIVVNSHSHSDHRENNYLFKNAIFYVFSNTIKGDMYDFFPTLKSMQIAPQTKILQTVGHTDEDISVICETKDGVVGIVGDLFKDGTSDVDFCRDEVKLAENQIKIKALSDFIIPGHGQMFKVSK